jgi:hypothetical protein
MKEQIQERIEQLKAEYESGQKMLADLETQESKNYHASHQWCDSSIRRITR